MKRPDTGKTFLDFDDINSLLPEDFKLESTRVSRGVYCARNGSLISISNSREYTRGSLAWYYVYADRYLDLGVSYMIFTVGLRGIIMLPMELFQPFKAGCYWKQGRFRGEKRYRVDVAYKNDGYYIINYSHYHQKSIDANPYFISFK